MSLSEACVELESSAGTHFDPEIVRVFVDEVRKTPPSEDLLRELETALDDPELQRHRDGDEPVLGYGPLALTDNLTLLYTRRYLHEIAQVEARRSEVRGRPFGVVLVELAEIAELNQRKGYAAGDEAIRSVSRTMQRAAARTGATACRYGGRRLGLLVPDMEEPSAEKLADTIVEDLRDGPVVHTGFSAWHPGDDGESVIVRARARLA
ncbi:MAG: diguanylate cyclase [Actinomycetota bacterium]|nr:diguanylate cyclase [Actinomycetota bacterium]